MNGNGSGDAVFQAALATGKGDMPTEIGVDEVRHLLQTRDAQLVEVLPEQEFDEEHLPGAININLKTLTPEACERLDQDRPVIVYCWDDL
ncbi:MAG: rhodanese-like domain-containing protein [Actinobacteria bacterium]|nr:rhodanese-like domain-containing protein [Actinomycetota bacterium]